MDGAEEPSAAHLTALCPSPSVRAFSTSPSVRRPLGAWLAASWPPPERADSTPGSGLIASAHLGCKRRTAHRPQQRGASPGGGNLRALGWRGEGPGRSVSRRSRGPKLTAGKGGAQRRGGSVWAGEGETAHETAATWGMRRPDHSHGLGGGGGGEQGGKRCSSNCKPERTPGLCKTEQLKVSLPPR